MLPLETSDILSREALLKITRVAVASVLKEEECRLSAAIAEQVRCGKAITDLSVAAKAIARGEICEIFVAANPIVWGRYDPATGAICIHEH